MSRNVILVIIVLIVIGVGAFFLFSSSIQKSTLYVAPTANPASGQSPAETSVGSSNASGAPIQTSQINISNFSFNPNSLTIKKGIKTTWSNNDSVPHTITSDSGIFNSQTLQPGDTFSFTFEEAGSFPYHCSIHPNMKATVVVTQ